MSTVFAFDDFFVDDSDGGVEEVLEMTDAHGEVRQVPITIKRGLSLGDFTAAQARATKTHLSPKGEQVIDGIDQAVMAVELLYRVIKSWPFTRPDGNPVPVTREYISALRAQSANAFEPILSKLTANKKEALDPFVKPSVEP